MKHSLTKICFEILRLYFFNPTLAFSHAGRLRSLIQSQGLRPAISTAKRGLSNFDQDIERIEFEHKLLASFKALYGLARHDPETALRRLKPYLGELVVIDIVHNSYDRLQIASLHILAGNSLFDQEFYSKTYMKGIDKISPADHYMKYGRISGLMPNAYFDPRQYVSSNPDIVSSGIDPILHYAFFGWREGRSAGSLFDAEHYLTSYPDVAEAGVSPLVHFLKYGHREGRQPLPNHETKAGIGLKIPIKPRGTIIIVSHDAELGGAQQVARVFAEWILSSTGFDVRFVVMRDGPFIDKFSSIAPTFEVSAHSEGELEAKLREFAGPDVKAILVNSVASGGFLRHWHEETAIISYFHEMPKLLRQYRENLSEMTKRSSVIIAGSGAVRSALRDEFSVDNDRLRSVCGFIEHQTDPPSLDFADKRVAKQALGIDPDTFLITACGVAHWRKSPKRFVQVADHLRKKTSRSFKFVWIGGGPDQKKCEELARQMELDQLVDFTGYEPDISRYLQASDLFLLPSEEDPFPLVCLYAAIALNPVICFENAGGMPEFVSKGCGRAIAFGDTEAMANAVSDYMLDEEGRCSDALMGRQVVLSTHTVKAAGPALLHHIRQVAGLKPHASVIVPNYNYEHFLQQRLNSISDQTFQDFEVILLDDQSSDNSVKILEDCTKQRPGTRLIVNKKNSGSPFAQWIAGMRLAGSDLIWIAEADDFCEPAFLETVLPSFDDRNNFIAYSKSAPVDEAGEIQGDYEAIYLDRIATGRWSHSYVATDHQEVNTGLGIANCIPNASSVIFRSFEPEPEFEKLVTGMKMCGDWLFYLRAMRGGQIAYRHETVNYHRRHGGTVTSRTEGSESYFDEFAEIRRYISKNYIQSTETLGEIERFLTEDLDRFGIGDRRLRSRFIKDAVSGDSGKALPSLLLVVSDLSPGGGQMFGIRLANAWVKRGGRAVLLNVRHFPDHPKVVSKIDSHVVLIHIEPTFQDLATLVNHFDIDIVHSSIWWADKFVYQNVQKLPHLPWVVSMHGCYETILDNPAVDAEFDETVTGMLGRVNCWVPTAKKNRRVFEKFGEPLRLMTIDNGVDVELGTNLSRDELGLRKDALVLILATRAIREKGWYEAVDAVKRLNKDGLDVELMLIGEGPVADDIRKKSPPHVHLFGHVDNLQDYIEAADIGLLPSKFVGESMPLVILEMMARGRPVIATDVGEIRWLLTNENGKLAGKIISLKKGHINISEFVEAIKVLDGQRERSVAGKIALERYKSKFTISKMTDYYLKVYLDLLN